jgi:hypothetical protein
MKKLIHILVFIITFISIFSYVEAREPSQEFDFTSIGFHGFYSLEISEENGQTVARSIYDPIDSPHYIFNEEKNAWKDNHPGRNDIELLFPPVRVSGRTIWKELAGNEWIEESKTYIENNLNRAVWNQEKLSYEMINFEHDTGHSVYWQPKMGILEDSDENKGYVNYSENIINNFDIGESGIIFDLYVSYDHPLVEYMSSLPEDLVDKYYSEFFLTNFPELTGKHVIVRLIDENITTTSKTKVTLNRDFWLQGDGSKLVNYYVTGEIENVSENLSYLNVSLGKDYIDSKDLYEAILWNYIAKQYAPNSLSKFKEIGGALKDISYDIWEESDVPDPRDLNEIKYK